MATTSASSPLFTSFSLLPKRRQTHRQALKPRSSSNGPISYQEDVVVVGAGIAGLATALSLHRLGVRTLVLEQGDSLRTGGTSLTLFRNGWRVLDSIGVGEELRSKFLRIEGLVMRSEDGRELRSFSFEDEAPGQEIRAVERRILLETLSSKLPSNTILFGSGVRTLRREGAQVLLELDDGSQMLAKIIIGCDGVRSSVARWMGFAEPKYVGHCAFRGLGHYPQGQPFKTNLEYIYGRGIRAGFVPVSHTNVYWFICINLPSPGPRIDDPSALKREALELIRSWPPNLINVIKNTPDDAVIKTPLVDRWLWPVLSPPASVGKVVVAGDAWHPMTPNLGQGACCALEDSVVLAGKLAYALKEKGQGSSVEAALRSYDKERWARVFPLTIRAHLVGSLLQWEHPLVCRFRNNVLIPRLVRLVPFLEHTYFDCQLFSY
ncbi:hypothetical protein HPP92_027076 [Vanilla planifolia]|uniref:FAD-binding domain-containing protein n=1 Tax=Vanilla planifolia TaxID=51239 RepID=A0A835U522_VANPL|nr:hypothetical protein HPP92_027076 [Vanilla planifolia]